MPLLGARGPRWCGREKIGDRGLMQGPFGVRCPLPPLLAERQGLLGQQDSMESKYLSLTGGRVGCCKPLMEAQPGTVAVSANLRLAGGPRGPQLSSLLCSIQGYPENSRHAPYLSGRATQL